ncbi:MAG: protein-glutamate O-methyltransferase CheR [Granulosicoccus sp.]
MNSPTHQGESSPSLAANNHSVMSDEVFRGFQRIALEQTGIELADSKRAMIVNRFSRRLDALGLSCFEEYLQLVGHAGHPEAREFIDTVTTNLTYFFREPHHFDVLASMVLPQLSSRINTGTPIRIWSAGCSSGAEPYTLGIVVKESKALNDYAVRILCTDIDTKMVQATQLGSYTEEQLRGLSKERRERWFEKTPSGMHQADEQLRSMLICKQLNLFHAWPIKSGVDVIMCRNVLIYFNLEYQKKLLSNFAGIQKPGGYLFLGHSETLEGFKDSYRRVDNTVYERI